MRPVHEIMDQAEAIGAEELAGKREDLLPADGVDLLHYLFGLGFEVLPEFGEQLLPLLFTGGNLVEFVFQQQ